MRNVSDESCREDHNTLLCSIPFSEDHAVYEIMRKNMVELDRPQVIIWHMRIACWITKAKTHTRNI
jgi:hypothetical protein